MDVKIVYEDETLILCHKRAGMAVQSARISQIDLESMLKNRMVQKNPGKIPYVGVVHRLDQPVEGLVLFAKNPKAAKNLSGQIARGEMRKDYLAVVQDSQAGTGGRLEDWLRKAGSRNYSQVVPEGTAGAKKAVLEYEIRDRKDGRMLVGIHLLTGRHHQIRVQMAHAGMPLIGDKKYGGDDKEKTLGLCAAGLQFRHPLSGRRMRFQIQPEGEIFQPFFA